MEPRGVAAPSEALSQKTSRAYVLREAFDYHYRQIADILQIQEANVRQLVTRARRHLADGPSVPVSLSTQRFFLSTFVDAAHGANLAPLENMLVQDVACE
ncbi:MAG TPA: sigma factor-like helix-turn-helix DNA-binding protein [Terriglobales bacterium]